MGEGNLDQTGGKKKRHVRCTLRNWRL